MAKERALLRRKREEKKEDGRSEGEKMRWDGEAGGQLQEGGF